MIKTRFNLAKQVSIIGYLNEIGHTVTPNDKREVQIKAFWRGDTNPSVTINTVANTWYDFGTNQGGSIIDLVSTIKGISPISAVNKILRGRHNCFSLVASHTKAAKERNIEVVSESPITHDALKQYLWNDRRIPDTIYNQFVKEIHYKVNGNTFFAVGFKNSADGWVLRNRWFKGCTSQHYTHFNNSSDELIVFEGVFDFLTYLTSHDKPQQSSDYLILNSTVNIPKASTLFSGYKYINCYVDNDEAGRIAYENIKSNSGSAIVSNCSELYKGYKDYNEWHISTQSSKVI